MYFVCVEFKNGVVRCFCFLLRNFIKQDFLEYYSAMCVASNANKLKVCPKIATFVSIRRYSLLFSTVTFLTPRLDELLLKCKKLRNLGFGGMTFGE